MNCNEFRRLIQAEVDGELDAPQSLQLEEHARGCAACTRERKSLLALRSAMGKAELRYDAPESLRNDLKQFVRDLKREEAPRKGNDFQWLWKLLAVAATACAVMLVLARPGEDLQNSAMLREVMAGHVRSLQAEHLTDVASSDQHTVKPWFAGKLDFSPNVRDFAEQGFPLIGGRLDYLQGREVAALVYRRNKHVINVFVWPSATLERTAQTESLKGYSIVNFDASGLRYCLVSDLNAKELNELAGLMGK